MKKISQILDEMIEEIISSLEESQSATEKVITMDETRHSEGSLWNKHNAHIHDVLLGLLEEADISYLEFREHLKNKSVHARSIAKNPLCENRYGKLYIEITEIFEGI